MTQSIDLRLHKNGDIIIQTKKVIMEHLLSFQNILSKDKNKKINQRRKKYGGIFFI